MKQVLRVGLVTLLVVLMGGGAALAARQPEDVFKGKIIVLKNRLPMRFSSSSAFVSAVKRSKTDRVWPTVQKGNEVAEWDVEYIAFFKSPLNDYEVQASFYDITRGPRRMVATDVQMHRNRGSRIFSSNIKLARPEFEVNHRYMMTLATKGRVIATTSFWLRGKAVNYSGKVSFSDEEARGK